MSVVEPAPYLWTREEYYRMAELGLFEGKRVELIEGQVIQMTPMLSPHFTAVGLVAEALARAFGGGYVARQRGPLSLGDRSDPEPDVAVVRGSLRDYATSHPTTAELVVEVSDSSLRFDRTKKASLYARAAIPEYWIVNLVRRRLEVHRDPRAGGEGTSRGGYATVPALRESESIAPLGAPHSPVAVADLFP